METGRIGDLLKPTNADRGPNTRFFQPIIAHQTAYGEPSPCFTLASARFHVI